ncbi:hypothetical protein [Congregibacter litoralis]|uniref:DUF302 domain-containing protein n=1 Tax=Congregibacter litoralis KT71 TaxID=314285 RepID=A4A7K0_9GAMM|nr:hypothetical protein [Congregibacter litoralis]EAQ98269.1 hypothetical protein KT71_03442 [Congregibacter litoralis KT71]
MNLPKPGKGAFFLTALLLSTLVLPASPGWTQTLPKPEVVGSSWVYKTQGLYHNVRDDLVQAIQDEGLVISYTAHLASMLRRTADATGAKKQVYENAESLLFCSAELTYELTLSNPHNITLCPYSISIYTLSETPDTVNLSIRAPELEQADYAAVHQLLEQIIAGTLSW